jgi:hypothetical protein
MKLKINLKSMKKRVRHSPIFILAVLIFWFVVRVGGRPSRILYPCQITLLNQMVLSTQTFFASSTNTFVIFWKRMVSSKLFWSFVIILVLFIVGLIFGAKGIRLFQ